MWGFVLHFLVRIMSADFCVRGVCRVLHTLEFFVCAIPHMNISLGNVITILRKGRERFDFRIHKTINSNIFNNTSDDVCIAQLRFLP